MHSIFWTTLEEIHRYKMFGILKIFHKSTERYDYILMITEKEGFFWVCVFATCVKKKIFDHVKPCKNQYSHLRCGF